MENKRKLFLFVCLFASTLLYGQVVGIKTNVLMDITKTINLGAEIGLSKKSTLDLYANYNPWEDSNNNRNTAIGSAIVLTGISSAYMHTEAFIR